MGIPGPVPQRQSHQKSLRQQDNIRHDKPTKAAMTKSPRDHDDETAYLEKKLGVKGKKSSDLPRAFKDDGLDELLEGLSDDSLDLDLDGSNKRKAGTGEWLAQKRRKFSNTASARLFDSEESGSDTGSEDDDDAFLEVNGSDLDANDDEEDEFHGFGDDGNARDTAESTMGIYVPPAKRDTSSGGIEAARRQIVGLRNRLSEMEVVSTARGMARVFRDYTASDVAPVAVEEIMRQICYRSALDEPLLILWAGFVAALYRLLGSDFISYFLVEVNSTAKRECENAIRSEKENADRPKMKEETRSMAADNMVTFVCGLYTFEVIQNQLIYDYIHLLLDDISDTSATLLLRIIRMSGPQLRRDNPRALKDVMAIVSRTISKTGEKNLSLRAKFAIEALHDLRDNKKSNLTTQTIERISRRLKIVSTQLLSLRAIKSIAPLEIRISEVETRLPEPKRVPLGKEEEYEEEDDEISSDEDDWILPGSNVVSDVARKLGFNTPTQHEIFIALQFAANELDGYVRISKLRLNLKQRREVAFVLIGCVCGERPYNQFYTNVAKRVLTDRAMRQAFQFGLWRVLRGLGAEIFGEQGFEGEEGEPTSPEDAVGAAWMFGMLIARDKLRLNILKCLRLESVTGDVADMVELLLLVVFRECLAQGDHAIETVFSVRDVTPELAMGLQHFLRKVMRKTRLAEDHAERKKVKRASKLAEAALSKALEE
jgi:nucleolar MIF4G domain-containing protein 1